MKDSDGANIDFFVRLARYRTSRSHPRVSAAVRRSDIVIVRMLRNHKPYLQAENDNPKT